MTAPGTTDTRAMLKEPLFREMLADYVSEGTPLVQACRTLGLNVRVVYGVIREDADLAALMEDARAIGADVLAEQILDIADDKSADTTGTGAPNKEWMSRSRLRVDSRRWLLSKWHTKKYGDKLEVEQVTRNANVAISDDPLEAARQYQALMSDR